jgi:hypothetical protein
MVAVFVGGIAAGVVAYGRLNPPPDYGPLPPQTEAAEPAAADQLTDLLVAGNDIAMANEYPAEVLTQLSDALVLNQSSMVDVRDVRYLGTVSNGGESLATYVAYGTLSSGTDVVIGFGVRVRDGQVVGVN